MPPRYQPQSRGQVTTPSGPSAHITTIGVRRPAFGTTGRPIQVLTNHFPCRIPDTIISHYDVVISPSEKLPSRLNFEIIATLQTKVAPDVFTPRAVYDGRKNLFAARELPIEKGQEFEVVLQDTRTIESTGGGDGRGPKPYKVRLNKVAEINPEVLSRFLEGKQSHDNSVLTAITALNVVIRMEPSMRFPFNVRSFFTDRETKDIGLGLILWRGYFQSVRPAIGRMLINIDINTGTMFKPGPLMNLCLEYLGKSGQPTALSPRRGLPDRERLRLQRFIAGIRVITTHREDGPSGTPRVIKKLSKEGASDTMFNMRDGAQQSVAAYFQRTYNRRLLYPENLCVEVGSGALLPIEVCSVIPGQIMRKQVPPEKTKEVLDFATKRPSDRLVSITNGLTVLNYSQSPYVSQFGMTVQSEPVRIQARVLPVPTLKYGSGSRQQTIQPSNGSWNMVDKRFWQPAKIREWVVVVYERPQRFSLNAVQDMVKGLARACDEVGITGLTEDPVVKYENGQGRIGEQLHSAGLEVHKKKGNWPNLIVCILPDGATDVYTAIKHFGDITTGVATQCLKSAKCFRAKAQYFANVCLKINVKIGGVNVIPDARTVPFLAEPQSPTMVMGADVVHPSPGSEGRPSFTSLVANVDSDVSKYIATSRVQTGRQEMIDDLEDMSVHVLKLYRAYRTSVERKTPADPRRIIFYRDGVSEGQFKTVLETEVPRIKRACQSMGMNPMPKITVIIVGKRHHVRFFPNPRDADKSGNAPAGLVVDRDVAHPTEFDFYLQSHGGLLGTSRPAHYNVLYDENNFQPDSLQQLSFALCHLYARSTRSVSIPAPVYYADIVCARAKHHFEPNSGIDLSDTATQISDVQGMNTLDAFKRGFKDLHRTTQLNMYFS